MKVILACFGLWLTGAAATLADPAPQSLAISVHGDGAEATRLPAYDPAQPIAVAVTEAGSEKIDTVRIDAAGPNGEAVHIPLQRDATERFVGSFRLAQLGTWQLRLTSHVGAIDTQTQPVDVDVQSPPPSNAASIGFAAGAGMFTIVGGSGFVLLRRLLRKAPEPRSAA